MLEMVNSSISPMRRRVLGLESSAILGATLALLVTAGVILLQLKFRTGQYEPDAVPIFYRLFLFEDYPASYLFLGALVLAGVPAVQRAAVLTATLMGKHPVLVSLVALAVFAAGSVWVYHAHPLSMDEAAPYMQSKIFAAGRLVGSYPPELIDWLVPPSFQNYFIGVSRETGEIASSYWPGFAMLLTPFMFLGVPWLCNPVLGACSVWVTHRLALRLTNSAEAAGAAALISFASAAFVLNSISFYSMTAHLLCNAVFLLLLLTPTPRRAFLAGLVGGLALTLHNPVPHMLFAVVWIGWLMAHKNRWVLLAALVAGYLPWIVVVGFGWYFLLRSLAAGETSGIASGTGGYLDAILSLVTSAFRAPDENLLWARAIGLSKFWLWAAPLSIVLAAVGFWRHRRDHRIQLLLASFVLTFVGYLLVPLNQGHGWGFRYLHSVWFAVPVLAAAAFVPSRNGAPSEPSPCVPWALAGALGGALIMVPYFAWQVHRFMDAHLAQLPRANSGRAEVMLINVYTGYYNQDLVQNDPFLRERPIRLVTHGRVDDERMLAEHFPDLVQLERNRRGSIWGYPVAGDSNRH